MSRCAWMLGRILTLVTGIAVVSATAQELHVSHQFHAQDDSRGRAAQIFVTEVVRRSPELKIIIHPRLSMGFTRDEQLKALQTGTLDFTVLPFFVPSKQCSSDWGPNSADATKEMSFWPRVSFVAKRLIDAM